MTESRMLKFALIGCGKIAERHAQQIQNHGILKATYDVDSARANLLAKQYQAAVFSDIDEMLAKNPDLDVVTICSPNGLHAEHTIKSLKAGFHVLCEKPMATTVEDCGKMIHAAKKANKKLFVVYQNRYNPPVDAVKKAIEEGKLGKICSVQLSCFWNRNLDYYKNSLWRGKKSLDGGTLFTQFSHFIDLLYWMIGDVKRAYPILRNFVHQNLIEFEDAGVAALEFYGGAIGTINYTVNSYLKNMEGSLTIFGEKGTVKIGGQYLNELEYQQIEGYRIEGLPQAKSAQDYERYNSSMSQHGQVYENIVEVLVHGGIMNADALDGLKTVEIIEKIYSQASG